MKKMTVVGHILRGKENDRKKLETFFSFFSLSDEKQDV